MRTLLVTAGSRGDVEPFAALARGLRERGHEALLAGPARFAGLAARHAVPFRPLDDRFLDLQDELAGAGVRGALTAGRAAKAAYRRLLADIVRLADEPCDVVAYHPKTLIAPMLAERRGVPAIAAQLVPMAPATSAFPAPLLPVDVPSPLTRTSWRLVGAVESQWSAEIRAIRGRWLGLPGDAPRLRELVEREGALNAWSPWLLPRPRDWRPALEPIGFWRAPTGAPPPPAALVDFVERGTEPVYVGFGSTRQTRPQRAGRAIRDALRRVGRRAIVVTGAGGLAVEPDDDLFVIDEVPHDWLLPRCAAAVHHGGIGTVAGCLRAGVPQVIRPFFGDQSFWAQRVQRLGAGVLARRVDARALEAALRRRERARSLSPRFRREDGVGAAVDRLVRLAAEGTALA